MDVKRLLAVEACLDSRTSPSTSDPVTAYLDRFNEEETCGGDIRIGAAFAEGLTVNSGELGSALDSVQSGLFCQHACCPKVCAVTAQQ